MVVVVVVTVGSRPKRVEPPGQLAEHCVETPRDYAAPTRHSHGHRRRTLQQTVAVAMVQVQEGPQWSREGEEDEAAGSKVMRLGLPRRRQGRRTGEEGRAAAVTLV
jgi:hypothetical protein